MPALEVCLTPELIHLHPPVGKTVVVTDILRATSCMVTALANGVESITPVASVEECQVLQHKGYIAAGERNGVQIDGFDLGNSPLSYLNEAYSGKKVAMTTTNGTLAISRSSGANTILIGAFLNLSSLIDHLSIQTDDLLIVCAGWKGKASFEDTLFAGALVSKLFPIYDTDSDAAVMAREVYEMNQGNLLGAIQKSSHYKRLKDLNIDDDFEFCATIDKFEIVPVLEKGVLVPSHR